MKRFNNKNFRVSSTEIIGLIVFLCLLLCSAFFYKSYSDTKGLYNIEKTKVDYIIQAPSTDQVTEISKLDHIDKVTPYYYRSVDVHAGKRIYPPTYSSLRVQQIVTIHHLRMYLQKQPKWQMEM